jgi:hypothetical protein
MGSPYKGPWEYFVRKVRIGLPNECWEWQASVGSHGYGNWCGEVEGLPRQGTAHKRAYVLFKGDPGDLFVLHKCGNRRCCNPDHLYAGTPLDNHKDCVEHGTHRKPPRNLGVRVKNQRGHSPLTEDDVRAIRRRREAGETGVDLAKEYGVTQSCIGRIHKRKNWAWVED